MAHLCGLCLTLKAEGGQASRALTGYDLLLLSVLVEAQTGLSERTGAAPCPLRGFRTADVLPATSDAARFAAAGSFLAGAAAVEDKIRDRDVPQVAAPAAARWAKTAGERGRRLAGESGFDGSVLSQATQAAAAAENTSEDLDGLLAASGRAVAALFAHTAIVAGKPVNAAALGRVGDAFGRLVHLLDAVEDFQSDVRRGNFNPLAATGTPPGEARRVADRLVAEIGAGLAGVDMADPELVCALLGPTLERSVARYFGSTPAPKPARSREPGRFGVGVAAAVALPVAIAGIFGGGRGWRRPPYYDDPYTRPGYGYGYRRRGPNCCECLACDCCANMACGDCCGGDDDCCVCCC
jgi:hypothetical protein